MRVVDLGIDCQVLAAEAAFSPGLGPTAGGPAAVASASGSGSGYDIYRAALEITGDVAVDVELIAVVEPDPGDAYV